jgi:maltose/moltooligosaccharide transporter
VISSVLPYILTSFGIANEAPPGIIPDSVKISFYAGACVFIVAIAYTVFTTKEYSPAELRSFGVLEEKDEEITIQTPFTSFRKRGFQWLIAGIVLSGALYFNNQFGTRHLEKELYVLTLGLAAFGLFQLLAAFFLRYDKKNALVEIMDDLNHLPVTMKKLAIIQFFSWFALFSMWIYTTPALAQHIYGTEDASSAAYNKMGNWVGVLFAWYNGFAALFAFLLPVLSRKYSRPITHMIALTAGGLGLISFYIFRNENYLIMSMAGIGFAWASILAMPYAILTKSLKQKKMGVYMGIFNFFIVLPQILAATLLGIFTKSIFSGHAIYNIVLGGCSMLVAAFLSMRLKEK